MCHGSRFLDELVTTTTLEGYYVVYLFAADMSWVYLCLGQGVTAVKQEFGRRWRTILHQRASLIRTRLDGQISTFETQPFDLHGSSPLSKAYGEAPAFYKKYSVDDFPNEEDLVSDLTHMLQLYNDLIYAGGTDLIENKLGSDDFAVNLTVDERKLYSVHRKVEGRADSKKIKKYHGYTCKVCKFNFKEVYGDLGDNYIEAHHLLPYSDLAEGRLRKLNIRKDFVVLCANCHRMIHRMESPADIQKLIEMLDKK